MAFGTARHWAAAAEERFHGSTEFTVLASVEEHIHCTVGEGQDSDTSSKNYKELYMKCILRDETYWPTT